MAKYPLTFPLRWIISYVNVETSLGRAIIRDLRELYCPDEHESRLSPEAQRLVDAIEAVLRLASSTRFAVASE